MRGKARQLHETPQTCGTLEAMSNPTPLPGPSFPLHNWVNFAKLQRNRLAFVCELAAMGDLVKTRVGPATIYFASTPDYAREVLVNQARKVIKGRGLQRSKRIFGEGLLTSEGDTHLRQRRLSQPAFGRQRLQKYGEAMIDFAARYRARWQTGEIRDMHHELMQLTLAIVGKTLFDTDIERESAEVGKALDAFMDAFGLLLLPFAEVLEKLPIPRMRAVTSAVATLDRIIYQMIAERRADGKDHGDLLSMLMAAQDVDHDGTRMSDVQLRDEAVTLLLAGHETTANALTWTLYLLSQHRDVEDKLRDELRTVLGDRPPTVADYPRLVYTEKVISESLRMFPPAWVMVRQVIEPLQLGEHTLEVGSMVVVSPYVFHHNPKYFPDPKRFDPERFSPEAKAARPRFTFIPFSAGPRNCIGEGFAWMEAVLVLSTLLQKWQFRLVDDQKVEPEPLITLRPKFGMRMRLQSV